MIDENGDECCEHGREPSRCSDCREAQGLVVCDDPNCKVKDKPETLEELRAAVEHWRHHSYLSGCSHGS